MLMHEHGCVPGNHFTKTGSTLDLSHGLQFPIPDLEQF